MQLTLAFVVLLQEFAPVFTRPSFATFKAVVTGWCLSFRPRFITELILSSGAHLDAGRPAAAAVQAERPEIRHTQPGQFAGQAGH